MDGGQDGRVGQLRSQPGQDVLGGRRVQAFGRLVEEQDVWVARYCPGQAEAAVVGRPRAGRGQRADRGAEPPVVRIVLGLGHLGAVVAGDDQTLPGRDVAACGGPLLAGVVRCGCGHADHDQRDHGEQCTGPRVGR